MKTDRRRFLSAAATGTLASSAGGAETVNDRYRKLDGILQSPVLRKQLFTTPVVIQSVQLLRLNDSYICRVRSKDGAEGIAVAHTGMTTFFPIFLKSVQPFLVGKDARELLEEYKFRYFEEPVMFDHIEEIKQVADALTIPVANGEQDYNYYGFRWLIAHDGLDIVQPDNYYYGGLIRSMKVARMAAAYGKQCVPHMSGGRTHCRPRFSGMDHRASGVSARSGREILSAFAARTVRLEIGSTSHRPDAKQEGVTGSYSLAACGRSAL